ncbi:acetylserotonin O-methyltransferase-like [Bidens hawaiensis]|uniref:acetylserotonin O-methyltransferase-like n=1 Tax=Bidens hawaiensis TaxID=980011 RepID=UPI00404A353F
MATETIMENNNSKEEVTAQVEIWKYIHGFTPIAVIKCAIELGIPDILQNRKSPVTLDDLVSEIGCSQPALYRIMRFLIHCKVFQEKRISETSVGYALTPRSRLLTRNGKNSMADLVLLGSNPVILAPFHKLSDWVMSNKDLPFDAAHGTDLWGFGAKNPEFSKLFNDGMACDARACVAAVIEGCPEVFEGVRTLVDVGGGNGMALRGIIEACPRIKGVNFDLPHVVSDAPRSIGVEHVGGDMFDHVPKADFVYLMKVLHDWADEVCIVILKKCREAIPQDTGKVIVVDVVVGHEDDDGVGLMCDMAMMTLTSKGKERTLDEWSYVFLEAGFTRYTVKHIRDPHSIIEVYP